MKEDIETLVNNANLALKEQRGFINCSALDTKVYFDFDTPENASLYRDVRRLSDSIKPMLIEGATLIVDFGS